MKKAKKTADINDATSMPSQKMWDLAKIRPYPNNPRTHPQEQVTLLATLMKKHGIDQPIVVDEDGVIIKGHGRRLAAIEAGFKQFPVIQHLGLSEDDKRAIRLSDNSVALLSGWEPNLLRMELADLSAAGYDMPLLGFSDVQLVTFMANVPSGKDPEATPEPPKTPVSRLGDVWLLGKHRLLCGDSTKANDVDMVLGGNKPNLCVTDQPYGVEYDADWRNDRDRANGKAYGARAIGKVENDDRADWREAYALFPGDVIYGWSADLRSREIIEALNSCGFVTRAQIIWVKDRLIIGRGDYHFMHEPCWYAVRKGKKGNWSGDRKQTTVWEIAHTKSETGHSTQKPIECMRRPIQNNSKPGDYVYEPFAGSGTTLIAAEMMNRYCLAIELNPSYVDVIVRRWQEFAQGEATLEGDGRTFDMMAKDRLKTRSAKAIGKTLDVPPKRRERSPAASPS